METASSDSEVDTLGGSFVCDTVQVSGNGDLEIDTGGARPAVRQFELVDQD